MAQGGWNPGPGGAPPGYGAPQQGYDPNAAAYAAQQQAQQQAFQQQQQGYQQAPYRAPPGTPGLGVERGFFGALFDFSFTSFVTTKVIKVLYGLFILFSCLGFLGIEAASISTLTSSYSYGKEQAMMMMVAAPFLLGLYIMLVRMGLEVTVVLFRIAENLSELNRKTKE